MTGLSNRGFYSSRKDTQRVSIRLDTRRLVLNFVREQVKYAVILISTVPVMIFFPFVQKYFMKGVMIGAVKG